MSVLSNLACLILMAVQQPQPEHRLTLQPAVGPFAATAAVAVSPDGTLVASTTQTGIVYLWNRETRRIVRVYPGIVDTTDWVAFTADGKSLITLNGNKQIGRLDLASGSRTVVCEAPGSVYRSLVRSTSTGSIVALIAVPEQKDGKPFYVNRLMRVATTTGAKPTVSKTEVDLTAFDVTPDGTSLIAGMSDGSIKKFDLATLASTAQIAPARAHAWVSASVSQSGALLAIADDESVVSVIGLRSGTQSQFQFPKNFPSAVTLTGDDRGLVVAMANGQCYLQPIPSGKVVNKHFEGVFEGEINSTESFAYDPSRRHFFIGSGSGGVHELDAQFNVVGHYAAASMPTAQVSATISRGLVAAQLDSTFLWDFRTGAPTRLKTLHKRFALGAVMSEDGSRVLTAGDTQLLQVSDLTKPGSTARAVNSERLPFIGMELASFGGTSTLLCAKGEDESTLLAINESTGKVLWQHDVEGVTEVGFNADVSKIALIRSSEVSVFDPQTQKESPRITVTGFAQDAFFSGQSMIILCDSGESKIIDLRDFSQKSLKTRGGCSSGLNVGDRGWLVGFEDGHLQLMDTSGKVLKQTVAHGGEVFSMCSIQGAQLWATCGLDGTVNIWDTDLKLVATLIVKSEDDWAVVSPDGRFDAANGGRVSVAHWVYDQEPIELEQLKADYYEPGLLAKLLKLNNEPLRTIVPLSSQTISLPPQVVTKIEGTNVTISAKNRGGGIGRVEVFLNGVIVRTLRPNDPKAQTARFSLSLLDQDFESRMLPVSATENPNQVKVLGYNYDSGTNSNPEYLAGRAVVVTPPRKASAAEKPSIFALCVGVSDYAGDALDLQFAAKDATDFARVVGEGATTWLGTESVHIKLLTSAKGGENSATAENIRASLKEIASQAKAQDIVLIYLSGHGIQQEGSKDYFYLASGADSGTVGLDASAKLRGLSGEEILQSLTNIKARKQGLILDTCASGALGSALTRPRDVSTDMRLSWERMKDRSGVFILAGCAADAVSYEASRFGQGLLTYALIEAIKREDKVFASESSISPIPFLELSTLFATVESRVPQLAAEMGLGGIQRPEFKAGVAGSRGFFVGQFSQEMRAKISLPNPRLILVKPGNIRDENDPTDGDSIGLAALVSEALEAESSRGANGKISYWKSAPHPGAMQLRGKYNRQGDKLTATLFLIAFSPDGERLKEQLVGQRTFEVAGDIKGLLPQVLEWVTSTQKSS